MDHPQFPKIRAKGRYLNRRYSIIEKDGLFSWSVGNYMPPYFWTRFGSAERDCQKYIYSLIKK